MLKNANEYRSINTGSLIVSQLDDLTRAKTWAEAEGYEVNSISISKEHRQFTIRVWHKEGIMTALEDVHINFGVLNNVRVGRIDVIDSFQN